MPRRYRFTYVKNGERKKQAIARVESHTTIHQLLALIKEVVLENGWVDVTDAGAATIHLCKCAGISRYSYDLTIKEDFIWALYIHGCEVNHEAISDSPALLTNVEEIQTFIQKIGKAKVCPGNPDEKFVEMISNRKKQMKSTNGQFVARVFEGYPV